VKIRVIRGGIRGLNLGNFGSKKVTEIVKSALTSSFPVIGIPGRCRRIVVRAVGDTALAAAQGGNFLSAIRLELGDAQ